ncbi:MAG: phage tail tape measure protein [Planctomycetaceae bacterium]|nr:phage tail tape measure protein [Planctomycetaceae bacterium]
MVMSSAIRAGRAFVELFADDTMRDVASVLKDLGVATEKLNKSAKLTLFKEIFGVWAMAGGASLTAAEFERLYDAVDNAGGVAARTAKEMDSGLAGSMRMLWSAVEAVAIAIGEALNPVLQPLVDWMTRACSGVVVYITKNKALIVTLAKTIAAIFGIGLALFTVGLGFIAVGQTIGTVAFAIAAVARVISSGFGVIGGCFAAVAFVGKSFVSVLTGVTHAIVAVATTIASGVNTVFLVLMRLGVIALTVTGGIVRVAWMLASGLAGALGLIIRAAFAVVTALVPIVAALASALMACVSGILSVTGTILSTVLAALAPLFSMVVSALAPLVTTCILGLRMIAGAVLISFASIAYVIASAFVAVEATVVAFCANVAAYCSAIVVTVLGAFSTLGTMIVSSLTTLLSAVMGFCASAFTAIGTVIASAFATAVSFIGSMLAPIVTYLVSVLSSLVASASIAIASLMTAVGGWIASVFAAMSPVLVVLLSVAAAVGAVYLLVVSLGKIGAIIGNILMGVVNVIGNCLSSILWLIVSFGVSVAAKFLQCFSWIGSAIWGLVKQVGAVLASGVGRIVSGIRGALTSAWDAIVNTFKTAFNLIGDLVTAFGNFFLNTFHSVGTAVEWLREQFGTLCSFAVETYGALVAALGRGDIEAAIHLIWASIKLIWAQGSNAILSTWYWVIDTLQTAWASCVSKISELLTKAWYGVQETWTESVYSMQTIWAEFSHGVITAWKKAEEAIAQGIGWIIAKMEGFDPNAMAKTIAEDYNRQSRDRENQKTQRLKDIQSDRDKRMGLLEDEKQGTLDILQSDFDKAAGMRNAAYQAKLAAQQRELEAAKAAYDEAIQRAQNPPPVPEGEEPETLVDKLKRKADEMMRGLDFNFGDKVSVTGSFSAAAIESMGVGTTMDRVAKATEQSEKHLAKIAGKDDKKEKPQEAPKKEMQDDKPGEAEGLVVKELKQHTRYLRDLSGNGLGAKFA